MQVFQERKKIRRILYSKVTLVAMAILAIVTARGVWDLHQKAGVARQEQEEAARTVGDLEARMAGLEASLERLHTTQGMEEELRQKYTVAKPDEEVVVIVDGNAKKGKNSDGAESENLLNYLKGFFE